MPRRGMVYFAIFFGCPAAPGEKTATRYNSRFAAIIPCRGKRHKRAKSERETQKIYRKFTDGGKET